MVTPPTRKLTIVAQDPSIRVGNKILTSQVEVPFESLSDGPIGHRVGVVDYDATTDTLYKPLKGSAIEKGDPFEKPSMATIMSNPQFHAQNVYAVVTRTLARFESALGRRVKVSWSSSSTWQTTDSSCASPGGGGSASAAGSTKREALTRLMMRRARATNSGLPMMASLGASPRPAAPSSGRIS